jgi:hypothetical protein
LKIQVEDKLFVESDERQFTIKQYTGKFDDKGKELFKSLGHFNTLNQALKHLVKLNIMKSDASTIGELIRGIEKIEKRINELIRH